MWVCGRGEKDVSLLLYYLNACLSFLLSHQDFDITQLSIVLLTFFSISGNCRTFQKILSASCQYFISSALRV